jgi:hypothetical protein
MAPMNRSMLLWHCECFKTISDGNESLILSEGPMRSDLVFGVIKQVSNRFLLANALAKATRRFHKPGTRIEDTTNDVLIRFDWANAIADETPVRISTSVKVPRSSPNPAVVHREGTFTALPVGTSSRTPSKFSRVRVA